MQVHSPAPGCSLLHRSRPQAPPAPPPSPNWSVSRHPRQHSSSSSSSSPLPGHGQARKCAVGSQRVAAASSPDAGAGPGASPHLVLKNPTFKARALCCCCCHAAPECVGRCPVVPPSGACMFFPACMFLCMLHVAQHSRE